MPCMGNDSISMESLMKYLLLILVIISNLSVSYGADKKIYEMVGVKYFNSLFGHVHQNPMRYSKSLTTITCGHPVKIFRQIQEGVESKATINGEWINVKVGSHQGYIDVKYLSPKKPQCFQDKFPKYFERFDLSLSEIYYWGKLFDMYVSGKSKVK